MRRFVRGGYRELEEPVSILVRDEIVGQFSPVIPAGAVAPSTASAEAPGAAGTRVDRSSADAAYRRLARSQRG